MLTLSDSSFKRPTESYKDPIFEMVSEALEKSESAHRRARATAEKAMLRASKTYIQYKISVKEWDVLNRIVEQIYDSVYDENVDALVADLDREISRIKLRCQFRRHISTLDNFKSNDDLNHPDGSLYGSVTTNILFITNQLHNKDISGFADHVCDTTTRTASLCNIFADCLDKCHYSKQVIASVLKSFQQENISGNVQSYAETTNRIEEFKSTGDPFVDVNMSNINTVRDKIKSTMERSKKENKKLAGKFNGLNTCLKFSNNFFYAVLAFFMIWSLASPFFSLLPVPMLPAPGFAACGGVLAVKTGINSILTDYKNDLKWQMNFVETMYIVSSGVDTNLKDIVTLMNKSKEVYGALLKDVNFEMIGNEAMVTGVEGIQEFATTINDLCEQVNKFKDTPQNVTQTMVRLINSQDDLDMGVF